MGARNIWVNFCTRMTDLTQECVRYNQVFVINRVCYNRVSLELKSAIFLGKLKHFHLLAIDSLTLKSEHVNLVTKPLLNCEKNTIHYPS